MSRHEQQDDKDKYVKNGHGPTDRHRVRIPVASMGSQTRTTRDNPTGVITEHRR
jgi:hypothetical protein